MARLAKTEESSSEGLEPLRPRALPVSLGQRRLWNLRDVEEGVSVFNLSAVVGLRGPLSLPVLSATWNELVGRHEALRTVFRAQQGGEPVQVTGPAGSPGEIAVVDLAGLGPKAAGEADRLARSEGRCPFDLERGPLVRFRVLRLSLDEHRAVFTLHRIISDAVSLEHLRRELLGLYDAHRRGEPSPLEPLKIQPADHAIRQREWLQSEAGERSLAFWRKTLEGAPELLDLPTDRQRPKRRTFRRETRRLAVPPEAAGPLARLARAHETSLSTALLACFLVQLTRAAGQRDLCIGLVVPGRNRPALEPLVGSFENTLVLRARPMPGESFEAFLQQTRDGVQEARGHQDLPFERLVEDLAPRTAGTHPPLVQVSFEPIRKPASEALPEGFAGAEGLEAEGTAFLGGRSELDLGLGARLSGDRLELALDFNTDLFEATTASRMLRQLRTLFGGAVEDPRCALGRLPLLGAAERAQVLGEWNDTETEPREPGWLPALVARRMRERPEAVAVVAPDGTLTYGELAAAAERMTRRLEEAGVGPETLVPVCMQRSAAFIATVVAILDVGAAYVPLAPATPSERLAFMLEDSWTGQPRPVLVTDERTSRHLPPHRGEEIHGAVDGQEPPGAGPAVSGLGRHRIYGDSLAYAIFTSGSTGQPKRVLLSHGGLANLVDWHRRTYRLGPGDRSSQLASLAFDASVWEIWPALAAGASLHLAPSEEVCLEADLLGRWMDDAQLTLSFLPTPLAESFLRQGGAHGSSLRALLTGGDRLREGGSSQTPPLVNHYGPTESTVVATAGSAGGLQNRDQGRLPDVGRPISNVGAYVLAADLMPVPPGVPGELFVAGAGLARGYGDRPALTAEAFLPNPFSLQAGDRLYRTGDRVRWLADGRLEFLERLDRQVKIRGFRIELGEIEAVLTSHPRVREAVVQDVPGAAGGRQLVAYLVAGEELAVETIRSFLGRSLPDYMTPAHFVFLDEMPLTHNGKLDRKALPAPELAATGSRSGQRTRLEEELAALWADVLEIDGAIGAADSFFELGGQSLLAGRLLGRVEEAMGLRLPPGAVFEAPTLRELAALVRRVQAEGGVRRPPLEHGPSPYRRPLTPQQLQLWLFEQSHPGSAAYNALQGFRLEGPLEVRRLEQALDGLLKRHESLHSRIADEAEGPVVLLEEPGPFQLPVVDLGGLPLSTATRAAAALERKEGRRPLALGRPPAFEGVLVRFGGHRHELLLTFHHAAIDGWSLGILRRELGHLYGAEGEAPSLPEPSLTASDVHRWQESWLTDAEQKRLGAFWRERLSSLDPLTLPTDRPRPQRPSLGGDRLWLQDFVAGDDLAALSRLGRRQGASLFMVLLAAFQGLLGRWSGQGDLSVGVPSAQRDHEGLEMIVAYLLNVLVVRSRPRAELTFDSFLGQVRETAVEAFRHQDLPFEAMVRAAGGASPRQGVNPLFQVLFQLEDEPPPVDLDGLQVEELRRHNHTAKFDLELSLEESGDAVGGYLEYATDLFDGTTMVRLAERFRLLLGRIARDPGRPLAELTGPGDAERHQLLMELNVSPGEERGEVVHGLFEAQAARTPEAPAVVAGGEALSYAELEAAANRLARHLQDLGVGTDDPVALLLDRSPALTVAVLAVLKAGGAYLPLDPSYPEARLEAMVEDGRPVLVIATWELLPSLPSGSSPVLVYEEAVARAAGRPAAATASTARPDSLAYVLFTSGSTARPKGVAMSHGALANLIRWQMESSTPERGLATPLFAALGFDVAFQEMFSTWASGGALHLVPETLRQDPAAFLGFLAEQGIERLFLPFVALQALAEAGQDRPWPPKLRHVITAGEQPRLASAVGRWLGRAPHLTFHNQYGPTESHVTSAWTWSGPMAEAPELPPIGRPISHHRLLVLDGSLEPAGLGLAGGLYLGGVGLARGYAGRPRWTAERFVPDPHGPEPGARLYRTGDRARILADGQVEYLGRKDFQVKIRGYRVELGEVETALEAQEGVAAAVAVMRRGPGETDAAAGRLVAYVVPREGLDPQDLDPEELRRQLACRLPSYMVPAAIQPLAELPKTGSGKLDRRALPEPAPQASPREPAASLPSTATEALVLQTWSELFRQDQGREAGLEDDFFALGGHSLLAARLASRLRDQLGVPCSVQLIFENPTAGALARVLERELAGGKLDETPPIPRLEEGRGGEPAPASLAQERFLVLHQLDPGSAAYVLWDAWTFDGTPDVGRLEEALRGLLRRHEPLRSRFDLSQEPPVQIPVEVSAGDASGGELPDGPVAGFSVTVVDVPALGGEAADEEARQILQRAARQPFDPQSPEPKLRAWVLRRRPRGAEDGGSWDLLLTFPHYAVDGWSIAVLRRDLEALYGRQTDFGLPPLATTYGAFAAWQREALAPARARDLSYWRQRLEGDPQAVRLPADGTRSPARFDSPARSYSRAQARDGGLPETGPKIETEAETGAIFVRPLSGPARDAVEALTARHGATPFMVLLTAFHELLRRLADQGDFVVGVPVAGRSRRELEALVGCFVNVLPLRLTGRPGETVEEAVSRLRGQTLEDLAHGEVAFDELREAVAAESSLGDPREALYETLFQVLDGPGRWSLGDAEGRPRVLDNGLARVELEWTVRPGADGLGLWLEYRRDLFHATSVRRWAAAFDELLHGMAREPLRPLEALPALARGERQQLVLEWDDTEADLGPDLCLHQLFEATARRYPERTAVVFGGEALTYGELEAAANRLARRLRQLGAGPERRIGVALERSLHLPVALLAVLKAGAAYVPLDPDLPAERLAFMAEDAALTTLVTGGSRGENLPSECPAVDLQEEGEGLGKLSAEPLGIAVDPANAAYAIYTSGSTGRPKGVVNSHRGIVNRLRWGQETLPLSREDRVLQKTPTSFDVSLWEIFWPLAAGAVSVYAGPGEHRDPAALLRLMTREGITLAHFVPSMLRLFLDQPVEEATTLRRVIASGEALPADLAAGFLGRSGAELYNLYGPTEAAVEVTAWHCRRSRPRDPLPIGRPIANVGLRVVDRRGRPVGIGAAGELLLTGTALARGYLGRPALTAAAFIPAAAAGKPGARAYRTGDLVRRTADGVVEYLGRIDHQVKVRGVRIELAEIEGALREEGAGPSVVTVWEPAPGDQRLVAYLVADEGLDVEGLSLALKERLPAALVPDHYHLLEALPLTPTGKVDRRALPEPRPAGAAAGEEPGKPPATVTEQILADLWREVLQAREIYRGSDFFHAGGHSLSAVRLAARLRSVLGLEVPLATIFTASTLEEQAKALDSLRGASSRAAQPAAGPERRDRGAEAPLSFGQERMLFLHRSGERPWAYHVPWGLEIEGPLHIDALGLALDALVRRHEVLRTALVLDRKQSRQKVLPPGPLALPVVDLRALGADEREAEVRELGRREVLPPFRLEEGEVLRALLLRLGRESHRLALTLHHAAADARSLEVLEEELWALYGEAEGSGSPLPVLPLQYADFALWQRQALEDGALASQLDYWRSALQGLPEGLELPADRSPAPGTPMEGAELSWRLPPATAAGLRRLAREGGVTLFMVLLGGFQALLSRITGQADVAVGAPVAGRSHPDLEGLMGLFINAVPVRVQVPEEEPVSALLAAVRQASLGAFQHQDLPFEKMVEELDPDRSSGRHPIFQAFFQLQVPGPGRKQAGGLHLHPWERPADTGKFELELSARDAGEDLGGVLEYDAARFDETTVRRLLGQLLGLWRQMAEEGDPRLGSLCLLSPPARQQVVVEWNDTAAELGAEACLHELVEAQVERTPEAVAVSFEGESWSYRRLDEGAEALARRLRSRGVGPEVFVGVTLERSPDMILSLLAILKAGGAYVPLDPALPEERIAAMVEDAGVSVVLTHGRWRSLFQEDGEEAGPAVLALDEPALDEPALDELALDEPEPARRAPVHPSNPAYAIFTSGSTGRPKGVVNSHRGIVNRLRWMQAAYGLTAEDRVLQKTPYSFDVSVWEFFWPLMTGARLVFARPEGHKDPEYLLGIMRDESITTVHFVPSMLQLFMTVEVESAGSLRRVITSGEALPADLERRFLERSRAELHNLYGPTEAAVDVTAWPCRLAEPRQPLPIGRPIANMALRVVDRRGRPLPPGVAGELLLVGPGLARGYRGRPGLTAERFIPDPLAARPGERAYRTGDLCRWCPDGVVDFLGRTDHQVKIRGFRIELGEIEAELTRHPRVREAVVQDRPAAAGGRQLVAYLVTGGELAVETLRTFLGRTLPEYMVPARFVFLEELPLNPNGKVDRKALPEPEAGRDHLRRAFIAPRTPTEQGLAEIWGELVKLDEIGVKDDFFDLGGHSLLAIHVVTHIRNRWGVDLPVAVLFGASTVEKLAQRVDAATAGGGSSVLVPMGGQELDHPPFFCVHGIGGNVFRLVQLARLMAGRRGFFGIQGWADLDDTGYLSSVEAMAERYAAEVEAQQPEGPLFLGGYSLGSMVAYEMARLFRERGRRVAFVGLLDVPAPAPQASAHVAAEYLKKTSYEGGMAKELGIPISIEKLKELSPQERLVYVLEEGRRHGALPPGFGPQDALRFIDVYRKTAAANHSYPPKPYGGDVTLFATGEEEEEDPTRGWGALVEGRTEVIPIPGDHTSMVRPPHVEALAEAMLEAMERAAARLEAEVAVTAG